MSKLNFIGIYLKGDLSYRSVKRRFAFGYQVNSQQREGKNIHENILSKLIF